MANGKDKLVRDQPVEMPAEQGPLAPYHGAQPPAPKWFEDAVATHYDTAFVECDGAKIHYQRWGDRSKPGLLFVHGNGAHAHWWDFVAPYLTHDYHVVAMTFSGMGDSELARDLHDGPVRARTARRVRGRRPVRARREADHRLRTPSAASSPSSPAPSMASASPAS